MMVMRLTKALRCGVFLIVVAWSAIALAQAGATDRGNVDSPGLVIEASAGWDGVVDRRKPVPISVLLNNYSERIIEGELFLSDPVMGYEVSLGEVLVSPGAPRRFTAIRSMTDWYECVATLRSGDQVLWRRNLSIMTGKEFDRGTNFVLFINEGGRQLNLKNAAIDPTSAANLVIQNHQVFIAGEHGRAVECLTVTPWQIPHHHGPLVAARAMVFAEESPVSELNKIQWQAIAEWMCQGGIVFVHQDSIEVIEKLVAASPLSTGPAITKDGFTVREIGLGGIYEFTQPLFDPMSSEIRERITNTTAKLPGLHIATLTRSAHPYAFTTGRSEINQVLVILFFGCYTALCGAALLLFRLNRRKIATYIISVVLMASVLSGALGVMLRMSQGDLRWLTITQAGSGGIVQVGQLNVQSSGGRRTTVAIDGPGIDLQIVKSSNRYYYGMSEISGFPPFDWTPASVTQDPGTMNVPMTPWGRRQLHTTAYGADMPAMEFELDFQPTSSPTPELNELDSEFVSKSGSAFEQQAKIAQRLVPKGQFSVKITNTLPIKVKECWLVIGVTAKLPTAFVAANSQRQRTFRNGQLITTTLPTTDEDQLIDLYQSWQLPQLGTGDTYQQDVTADLQIKTAGRFGNGDRRHFQRGNMLVPRISHLGAASAWIIASLEESPVLKIDEARNDFTTHEGVHFFIQEITPANMPDPTVFYDSSSR